MKIAFLSDVHVGPTTFHKGIRRKLTEYSEINVYNFLEMVGSRDDISFAIHLGDLIQDVDLETDRANYKKGAALLRRCSVPLHHVIGNHDTANLSLNDLCDILNLACLHYSFELDDYHFVFLYTHVPDHKTSRIVLPDAQLAWLAQELAETDKPTVVFCHHSLADQELKGNPWFEDFPEGCLVENRADVRRIMKDSGKVIAVVNGHLHWNQINWHDDIPFITVQSAIENFDNQGTPANAWGIIEITGNRFSLQQYGNDPFEFAYDFGWMAKTV